MLAPPTRRAVTLRRLAPRSAISSSRRGTAVCGDLAGFPSCSAQRGRRQEHVGQTADAGRTIVQHDRDAAAQSHGDQLVARSADLEVGDLDDDLAAVHAARR